MSYHYSLKTNAPHGAESLKVNQDNKNNSGFASLKKGQRITGTVISVDGQVTLDFNGQNVTTSKNVFNSVMPGDIKNFEVVKANENEIELKLLDEASLDAVNTIKAFRAMDNDLDKLRAKKEQTEKKADQEAEYKETKDKLDKVTSTLTEHDCSLMEQEGFQIESFTVDGLAQALNRVKTGNSYTENNTKEKMNSFDKEALGKRLKQENLPATEDNINKLSSALNLSGFVANMDDKTMQYLIATNSEPSVENIYKAYYSGNTQTTAKLSDTAWSQIKSQVADVVQTAGYTVNDQNLADAKWILENNLPLTSQTFTYKKSLDSIKIEDKDEVLNTMLDGMKQGINPKDVSLLPETKTDYKQIITDIQSISDEAVTEAVSQGRELTIVGLVTTQKALASGEKSQTSARSANTDNQSPTAEDVKQVKKTDQGDDIAAAKVEDTIKSSDTTAGTKDNTYEELKARRQLEEIRLKMTVESAANLEKKGISVETEELSKVVEELRKQEDEYYKNILKEADADTSDLSIQLLKETTQSIEQLRYMPCSVLGSTLIQRNSQTITGLLTQGSTLAADYAKAGNAYETLATVPNAEYGDSIKKAFANADSILTQMGLDNTEENRRAIRILGYNQMDITEASVNQVKAYDKQVTSLIENLHPAVTVRMIKDGMNPMNMTIRELNQTIDNIKEEQGITSEDKFSTYLYNLEKQQGITSEERKAYIGIYRLLYNVDKSDGAALGSVIKSDREVTLGNLLTAIQTSKKGSIDSLVNDELGSLQEVNYKGESIAEQLRTFDNVGKQQNADQSSQNFEQTSQNSGNSSDDATKEQTEYLDRILKQIKEEVTPEKLMEAGNSINYESSLQNQSQAYTTLASSDKSLWEKLKGVPVEKLLEQLRNTQDPQTADSEIYTQKVQEIRELCKTAEQSIRFLNDYRMPSTSMNIMMANSILSNGESPLKKLLKQKGENQTESLENSLKETDDLSDTLIDKNSMQDAYEQLETQAKDALGKACSEEVIDSRRLAELKSVSQQMTFLRTLAGKEFYQIPIETDKGITNMNLTILRGTDTSGKVSVNVWSQTLGNIKAEFTLKDQALKGFFSSDNREGLERLKQNTGEIETAAQNSNITIKQMDFGMLRRDNENYSYQNPDGETGNNDVSNSTERILYRIAKAVVQTVRSAENSNIDAEAAD